MEIPFRELQHCNSATPQQRVQRQTCLSFAERQQCRQRQQRNRQSANLKKTTNIIQKESEGQALK